jgi:hypothetical protein
MTVGWWIVLACVWLLAGVIVAALFGGFQEDDD